MGRQALEVADIFRDHGPAWREINRGHLSLGQLKVINAIEHCRTAALGGHVMRCENDACGYTARLLMGASSETPYMKTRSHGQGRTAGVGFESGPLVPTIRLLGQAFPCGLSKVTEWVSVSAN